MDKRVEKMKKMAEMEEEYAVTYNKDVTGLGNVVIAELMRSVSLDSKKHAGLYRAIATILQGPLAVTDTEYDQLETGLKEHIQVEEKMLEEVKTLMETEEDQRVKTLLMEIHADETKHHKFLSNLLEAVIKKDMIFEEDIWEMLWRDVPWHGAPRDPYA